MHFSFVKNNYSKFFKKVNPGKEQMGSNLYSWRAQRRVAYSNGWKPRHGWNDWGRTKSSHWIHEFIL